MVMVAEVVMVEMEAEMDLEAAVVEKTEEVEGPVAVRVESWVGMMAVVVKVAVVDEEKAGEEVVV
jgi:hypothetical protein